MMPETIKVRVVSSEEAISVQSAVGSLAVEAVSPRVSFEKVSGGTRLDITDVDGTKSTVLPDGEAGPAGPAGPQGERGERGPQGEREGSDRANSAKRIRAHDGCLGIGRRRRTRKTATSFGEPSTGFDPEVSEWGNPAGVKSRRGRLRQASGSRQQALIRRFPNGATRRGSNPAIRG